MANKSSKISRIKKNLLPLKGNKEISFDQIEIITRTSKKKIHQLSDIKKLPKFLKKN